MMAVSTGCFHGTAAVTRLLSAALLQEQPLFMRALTLTVTDEMVW